MELPIVDPNKDANAQLMAACKDGDLEMVMKLVNVYDIDPKKCKDDKFHGTVLHAAASNKHCRIVQFLIESGKCDNTANNRHGQNVFHRSVRAGDIKTVKYLVKKDFDPMTTCGRGRTGPHHACIKGHLDIVKYFIEDLKLDFSTRDRKYLLTPLDLACEHGSLELVRYVVEEHGYDIKFRKEGYNTPLHQAAYGGQKHVAEYLIKERGYKPMCKGWKDKTPLHSACKSGRVDMVRYLLEKEPQLLNLQAVTGSTPLHKAAESNQMAVVKILVEEFSCDITVTNSRVETAAMTAKRKLHDDIATYLNDRPSAEKKCVSESEETKDKDSGPFTTEPLTVDEKPTLVNLRQLRTVEGDVNIIRESACKDRDICIFLLNDVNGAKLRTIRAAANDQEDIIYKVYEKWMEEDEDYSWKKLSQCFKDCELNVLARKIDKHFGPLHTKSHCNKQGRNFHNLNSPP